MPNSHSCSRGKVWRRSHRQSGKRIPGACVKKSKSIRSMKKRSMKKRSARKSMRSMKKRSARKSKSKKRSMKKRSSRKSKSKKRSARKSKSKSKSKKYHGLLDDAIRGVKDAANKLTGAATKAAGALVPSGVPYLSSAAKKAIKGAGEAAKFQGIDPSYHRMFRGLPRLPKW